MDITLIIPAYNEEAEIAACIDVAKKYSHGRFREIIVVDNASSDRTGEIAREHGARVVREDRKGLPFAREAGVKAAQTPYIAFIDADTHLSQHWFGVAEKTFAKYPHIVAMSGPRRYFGTRRWRCWILNAFWIFAPLIYWITGYMILGGNFIVRKSAIEKIGASNPDIKFYGEDTDLARRLSRVGKVMFKMNFYVYSSARRFETEGIFKPNITYALNYAWPALFGKPYTAEYRDVRRP